MKDIPRDIPREVLEAARAPVAVPPPSARGPFAGLNQLPRRVDATVREPVAIQTPSVLPTHSVWLPGGDDAKKRRLVEAVQAAMQKLLGGINDGLVGVNAAVTAAQDGEAEEMGQMLGVPIFLAAEFSKAVQNLVTRFMAEGVEFEAEPIEP